MLRNNCALLRNNTPFVLEVRVHAESQRLAIQLDIREKLDFAGHIELAQRQKRGNLNGQ
jgi:hypothetical protein